MAVSLQTGIREFNGDLSPYTGMLGGLTPDVHTLRSLNPLTTNRVLVVMFRGPYFLMRYFGGKEGTYTSKEFTTYKKIIEYYNTGITCNIGDASLAPAALQGGFAGRSINIPTTQNTNNGQTLTISVPELVGRPVANFHNMWIDGIADPITGLTTYHGGVAGSIGDDGTAKRIFAPANGGDDLALEPSPAWEVGEFMIIALDRSGARVEAAVMALGCIPQAKVGNEIFNSNAQGQSNILTVQLTYSCQYVQSSYVNDLAARYVRQFAVFGNSMNLNPGAGDAFFTGNNDYIDSEIFNKGERPHRDAVQSSVGNAPVFYADQQRVERTSKDVSSLSIADHSQYYYQNMASGSNNSWNTENVDQYEPTS
jgi:hypothetical protein